MTGHVNMGVWGGVRHDLCVRNCQKTQLQKSRSGESRSLKKKRGRGGLFNIHTGTFFCQVAKFWGGVIFWSKKHVSPTMFRDHFFRLFRNFRGPVPSKTSKTAFSRAFVRKNAFLLSSRPFRPPIHSRKGFFALIIRGECPTGEWEKLAKNPVGNSRSNPV